MRTFDDDILTHITKSGVNISETEFVKLDNEEMPYSKNWCPLNIPIHTVAEEVDLNYYIDMIINYFYECSQKNLLEHEFEYISTAVDIKLARKLVLKTSSHQAHNIDDGREQLKASEERLLRHLITAYMPQLTDLYNQYATFTKNEEVPFKATLIRLFLWQLLRDIGLPHQGITLVETDLFLANNPSSCVESDHYPFEPIYLWQFLQSLIGCCWLLFLQTKEEKFDCYTNGIIAQMFRQFLEYTVFPNAGKFEGSALTDYKDLLPIKPVYKMYLNIGEPHTVRDFLYQTCAKKGKNPPCYAAIKDDTKLRKQNGNNAVMLGHKIMFLEGKPNLLMNILHPVLLLKKKNTDLFSVSLYTFRSLGKRKIVYCMAKVCPKIFTDDGSVDMEYKLTFLEFYEIVLQCTYEKVERKRRIEEKCKQKEFMLLMKESETEQEKR
ncbi:hypothetical protein NQ317_017488 [Molorchus minor]|uniref:Uncharacterized protein n=1 Tax=Molorchus minor TaxID=1323400 RepID=A0ABQ9JL60_9CUCU|nr:hypothetical protein NQ317_017488 [Molorchus minor]